MTAPSTAPDAAESIRMRTQGPAPQPGTDRAASTAGREVDELVRTRDEAEDRARGLPAAQLLREHRNGSPDERARRLVLAVRRDLLLEFREQEQQQARRQLAAAADSSEGAVAGPVNGVTTIVRSLVPAVPVRPEEVVEAAARRPPGRVLGRSRRARWRLGRVAVHRPTMRSTPVSARTAPVHCAGRRRSCRSVRARAMVTSG